MKKLTVAALSALTFTVATATALAEEAPYANKPQIGAAVKYGIYTGENEGTEDFNPYGLGLGVSGGYTLDMGVHVGAGFDYFFGDSIESDGLEVSANIFQLMGIVGYDVGLSEEFTLRPQVGIGVSWVSASLDPCPAGAPDDFCSQTESELAIAPGVKGLYDLGGFFVSGEASYNHRFSDESSGGVLLGIGAGAAF
jgi:hypothetical protein